MKRAGLIIALASIMATLAAGEAGAQARRLEYYFPAAPVEARIGADGTTRFKARGAGLAARPGEPALPGQVVRIAVPPDAVATSVEVGVVPVGLERLPGVHDVAPAPPMAWIGRGALDWGVPAASIVDGRNPAAYAREGFQPEAWGAAGPSLGGQRRYRFATVRLHPVRYRPSTGTLERAAGFRVSVRYERSARGRRPLDFDCGGEALASRLLVNHEQARSWYPEPCAGPPLPPSTLAIITTDSIVAASSRLADYRTMREDQGWTVIVATEAQWDEPTGELLDDRADRIRAWLRARYVELDIGFVMLVGNPDPSGQMLHNIPMKPCSRNSYGTMGQTDSYYADLSGNWDSGGTGVVCEWGLDDLDWTGEGVIDFIPEVYVGRIPTYSDGAVAVDEILTRVMDYERASAEGDVHWRRRMLLPNSIYFFDNQYGNTDYRRWDGATVGEWFIRDQLQPRGMEWTTLYEQAGISPSNFPSHLPLETPDLVDQWNRGYGLAFWTGHGSNTGVFRLVWTEDTNDDGIPDWQELSSPSFMDSDDLHMLLEAPPPFVIHGSCSNGYPESSTNLGYAMLRRGAIGTVSASREAMTWHWPSQDPEIWEKPDVWDGDVIDIVTEFSVNLLDGMEAGRALGEAIALTTDLQGGNSWYQKAIQNLYGDPLVRLVMCRDDDDCDNGVFCDGQERCEYGSCVPGPPVECGPVDGCDDVLCDEEAGACVPGPTCEVEPDTDDHAATPGSAPISAGAGCAAAAGRRGGGLKTILGLIF